MKTITNIKRGVKHSIKHRAQRKYKTHKNKHTKTHLKQYKTHKGGAGVLKSIKRISSNKTQTEFTPTNLGKELRKLGTSTKTDGERFGFLPEVKAQSGVPAEVEKQSGVPAEVKVQIVLPAEVAKQSGVPAEVEIASGTDVITDILKKKNISINVRNVLKTTSTYPNTPIKNILLALFITLARSVTSKEHCGIYIGLLENQYYRRLMTYETYVTKKQGMQDIEKKFYELIESVIVNQAYFPSNGEHKTITTLRDWVIAIEELIGFERRYKDLLAPENLNPKAAQDILEKLKEYCNTQPEESHCTYLNPCCDINKKNKDNNVANKRADLLDKEIQTMLLQTIKLNKNELKLEADKRLIIKNNIAKSMYTWLKSTDNLEAKYNLYIKSQDYKNLQITLPLKLQAGVAIS